MTLEMSNLTARPLSSVMTTNSSSYCRMSTGRRGLAVRLDISSVMTTNSSNILISHTMQHDLMLHFFVCQYMY
jgi:hypothetical protein